MQTLKPTEIAEVGEQHVAEWLSENGFINVVKNSSLGGNDAIEANGSIENILVHVRTSIKPTSPREINEADKTLIKSAAEHAGRKAYVAFVVIDDEKKMEGEISWQRLS